MGVALGRNPNGAVRDIAAALRACSARCRSPLGRPGGVAGRGRAALAVAGAITGWGLDLRRRRPRSWCGRRSAEAVVRAPRAGGADRPLEWAGIDRTLTADEVRELDAALGLAADPEEAALAG